MATPPNPGVQKPAGISIKFFLVNGGIVDWPVPDPANFSFHVLVASIRTNCHFLADQVYIPADQIACVGMGNVTVKQPMHQAPARPQ